VPELTVPDAASTTVPGEGPSSTDERIKAFQRMVSEREIAAAKAEERAAALERRLEEIELAQLPETQRGEVLSRREQSRIAKLEADLVRARLALQYPDVAEHMNAMWDTETAEGQYQYLRGLLKSQAGTTGIEPSVSEVSEVDLNNPMRGPSDPVSLPLGAVKDAGTADRILAAFGNATLGSLRRK
jgi:hypothetical protein